MKNIRNRLLYRFAYQSFASLQLLVFLFKAARVDADDFAASCKNLLGKSLCFNVNEARTMEFYPNNTP